jgi:pimeloyl-ACP methyl ester carboxylesterase
MERDVTLVKLPTASRTFRRHRLRGLLGLCLSAVLLTSGCSINIWGADEDRGTLRQLDGSTSPWRDCAGEAKRIGGGKAPGVSFSCAKLRVPQDWTHPNEKTFSVALMRARKQHQSNRIGSLLVNPGGPGASGIELAAQAPLFLPQALQERFDIVGFDPRGVGESSPVRCISDKAKDTQIVEDPTPGQAGLAEQSKTATDIAKQCRDKYGDTLRYYSTEQTARDMDAIRSAMGDAKLNYLGYSYGTLLGSVYAKLFGPNIRSMVLDGPIDPNLNNVETSRQQAAAFEKAFDAFANNCRQRGKDCKSGTNPRATMQRVIAKSNTDPARDSDGRRATEGVVVSAAISALYTQERWGQLDSALHDLDTGRKADSAFSLVDEYFGRKQSGKYDNSTDAELTVTCTDDPNPPSAGRINQLRTQWQREYPVFGATLASSLLGCSTWQGGHDPYETGQATGAPPIVVVGTTGDPATPYANAARLAQLLGTGTVLTWQGEGHTAYPQVGCITNAVNDYLISLRVPENGARCS